jgi:hypothetical protein
MSEVTIYTDAPHDFFVPALIISLITGVITYMAYMRACAQPPPNVVDEDSPLYDLISEQDEKIETLELTVKMLEKKVTDYQDLACQMLDRKIGINETQS